MELRQRGIKLAKRAEGDVTWVNTDALLDVALGAALVTVSEKIDFDRDEVDEGAILDLAAEGARRRLDSGLKAADHSFESFRAGLG